jgi:hypothetical protein
MVAARGFRPSQRIVAGESGDQERGDNEDGMTRRETAPDDEQTKDQGRGPDGPEQAGAEEDNGRGGGGNADGKRGEVDGAGFGKAHEGRGQPAGGGVLHDVGARFIE